MKKGTRESMLVIFFTEATSFTGTVKFMSRNIDIYSIAWPGTLLESHFPVVPH